MDSLVKLRKLFHSLSFLFNTFWNDLRKIPQPISPIFFHLFSISPFPRISFSKQKFANFDVKFLFFPLLIWKILFYIHKIINFCGFFYFFFFFILYVSTTINIAHCSVLCDFFFASKKFCCFLVSNFFCFWMHKQKKSKFSIFIFIGKNNKFQNKILS